MVLGADLSVVKGSGLDELLDAIAVGRETRRRLHSSQMNGAALTRDPGRHGVRDSFFVSTRIMHPGSGLEG